MKFRIEKSQLLKGLSKVESIISVREIRSTLSNILVEAEGGQLRLTASDFEITSSTVLPAEITQEGTTTIPARKLSQIINNLQAEEVSLNVTENNNVKINGLLKDESTYKGTGTRYDLMGFPSEDYPTIPPISEDEYTEISKNAIIEMFNKVSYAMAKEDARYVFNGLCIVPEGKIGTFIATDGRRLSLIRKEFPVEFPLADTVIIPHKTVHELQKLSDEEGELNLAYNKTDKRIYFRIGNTTITSKLIEGNFPDYKQVIPQKIEHEIPMNKEVLENSIQQVAVMATEPTRQVRLSFDQNKLYLHASTPDIGEAEDSLVIQYSNEEKIETAFNSRYVIEVLKALETEEIVFGISSSSSPVSIQKPGNKDFMAIIMPMKV